MSRATGVFPVREPVQEATLPPWERKLVRTAFLVVDDDQRQGAAVRDHLRPYPTTVVGSLAAARRSLQGGGTVGLVLDERPAGECALGLVDELRSHHDRTPILVLLRTGDLSVVNECHLRGVSCVAKAGAGPNLRRFAGDVTATPTEHDVEAMCRTFERRYRLTKRLSEVLGALVRMSGTTAIAAELGMSPRTVEGHVQTLMAKTGMSSREEIIIAVLGPLRWGQPTHVDLRIDGASR